jgi:SHS family lactate transporter-like MFS transporter
MRESSTKREVAWWREPTRGQWMAFSAAWAGWVLDGFDFTIYLLVVPEIAKEFGVGMTAVMGSLTLTLLVRLLGGVAAGALADRYGRKLPLMLSLIWFAVFDGLVALAPSFTWVLVLRTMFGFGMGAEWTAGSTLAMESWPARSRGIASGLLQGSWAIGFLLAALVSAVVVPAWGWRALFVVAIAPALLALPIRMWVPESEEWLRRQEQRAAGMTAATRTALPAGLVWRLVGASFVMALGFGVYYAMTSTYPALLAAEHGLGPDARWRMVALFNVGMLVGAVVCGWAAKRHGVRWAVAVPALAVLPVLPLYVGAVPGALGVGAFLGGMLGVGYCGVTPMLLTDMFPAEVRGRCVGLAYHAGAVAAAVVVLAVPALHEHGGVGLGTALALVTGVFEVALAGAILLAFRPARQSTVVYDTGSIVS